MKTLYFECNMGAAGDMLMASLLELLPDQQPFLDKMNHLGLPGVKLACDPSVKCGVKGTHVRVTVDDVEEDNIDRSREHGHIHHHAGMHEIEQILSQLDLAQTVRSNALSVYRLIAEAESRAHGRPVEQIHFHEIGTMDAIADIVGVCLLMDILKPDQVFASPIRVGFGQVSCAHGMLPVPAPATAYLLRDVPIYSGTIQGELCTPTGAALLKHFVDSFVDMPVMRVSQIGYGMGKKEFEAANCVRALLGETNGGGDEIVELCCNLDDMSPEAISFAQERLLEAGALDVYTTAIGMKKSRPAVLLSCLCQSQDRESMIRLLFKHTTTLGIRENSCRRYTLARTDHIIDTEYGPVRIKKASGWGVEKQKAEYEDVAKIAREQNLPLGKVIELLKQ